MNQQLAAQQTEMKDLASDVSELQQAIKQLEAIRNQVNIHSTNLQAMQSMTELSTQIKLKAVEKIERDIAQHQSTVAQLEEEKHALERNASILTTLTVIFGTTGIQQHMYEGLASQLQVRTVQLKNANHHSTFAST